MKKICAVLALIAMAGCAVPIPVPAPTPVASKSDQVAVTSGIATPEFTRTLNSFRASQGRGAVQQSATLTRAATLHARDMTARSFFSHRSPGGPNGTTLSQRARASGCNVQFVAENIAQGSTTVPGVFEQWQNSAGHRRNMLGARYNSYGLGRSGNVWVLMLSSGC